MKSHDVTPQCATMHAMTGLSPLAGAILNLAGRYIDADMGLLPLDGVVTAVLHDLRLEIRSAMSDLAVTEVAGATALDAINALLDHVEYPPPPPAPTREQIELAFAAA